MMRFLLFVLLAGCSSSNADEPTVTARGAACTAHTNCGSLSTCALDDDGKSSVCRPYCTSDDRCPTSDAPCVKAIEVDSEPRGSTTVTVCK